MEEKQCNTKHCPIDCEVSKWTKWSKCSEKCGGGKRTRTRNVTVKAQYDGESCPKLTDEEDCNTDPCPIDCKVGKWGDFSKCSVRMQHQQL